MTTSISNGSNRQNLGIETAPYLKATITTQKIMAIVAVSLIPALFVQVFFFGFGILWQFIISVFTATLCEIIISLLRHRKIIHSLSDLSYVVTALILAFTLPPLLPCYYTVVASIFAIVVVKSVFGGLGHNIFNPAMAGFIFIVISCPQAMTNTWVVPAPYACNEASLQNTYNVIFSTADPVDLKNRIEGLNSNEPTDDDESRLISSSIVDSFSGATYLESIKSARKTSSLDVQPGHDFTNGNYRAYLALAIAYGLGALVLAFFRIILIKMVFAFVISFALIQGLMHHLYPGNFMNITDGFLFGGTLIAAFYIITDPVTNAGTSKGRIYFSILVAFLIIFLRAFGSYSDAVAFAVMLGNACAPLIDVLTHRRPYGFGYKKGGFQ